MIISRHLPAYLAYFILGVKALIVAAEGVLTYFVQEHGNGQ